MWRITDDFWDSWELLKPMFWRCETWLDHVKPGCYPDCDMLPVGMIGGKFQDHNERMTAFTKDEQKTMMSLWCMFGAPLMIGADLTQMDDWTLALLTNRDLLSMLDGKHHGTQVVRDDGHAVWMNICQEEREISLGLFNLSEEEQEITVTEKDLEEAGLYQEVSGLTESDLEGRRFVESWGEEGAAVQGGVLRAMVPAHGVRVYKTRFLPR